MHANYIPLFASICVRSWFFLPFLRLHPIYSRQQGMQKFFAPSGRHETGRSEKEKSPRLLLVGAIVLAGQALAETIQTTHRGFTANEPVELVVMRALWSGLRRKRVIGLRDSVTYQNLKDCRVPLEDDSVIRSISLCILTASAKVGASCVPFVRSFA
jgi:hypothetical protein